MQAQRLGFWQTIRFLGDTAGRLWVNVSGVEVVPSVRKGTWKREITGPNLLEV